MRARLFLVVVIGCGGAPAEPSDAASAEDARVEDADLDDATPDAEELCELDLGEPLPSLEAHEQPFGAGAEEARAGRLLASQIPENDLLTWAEGDFVLANDRIAVVIEDAGDSDGYDPWGGKIVGVAEVDDGELVRAADFNELISSIGRHTVLTEEVRIVDDGSNAAVIEAEGWLQPIPFAESLTRVLAPGDLSSIRARLRYRLEPGAEHVDVSFRLINQTQAQRRAQYLHLFFQGNRMTAFGPERGATVRGSDVMPWVGYGEDGMASYIVDFQDGDDPVLALEVSGAALFLGERFLIDPCSDEDVPYYKLHIGNGMTGARAAQWRHEGTSVDYVEGTVTSMGEPAAMVSVHVESADGAIYYGRATSDETGAFRIAIPEGADTRIRAYRPGEGVVGPVAGPDLELPATGQVSVRARDGSAAALPVRVQSEPLDAPEPTPPERFGEGSRPARRTHVDFPIDGQTTLRLLPGNHRVTVSRGYEYTAFQTDVVVEAGETVDLDVVLDRVVDTAGFMCADYHIHTNRSPDSPDPASDKLHSAAGDGLEIPCRSDHEWVRDWDDQAQSLGVGDWLYGVTSLELTTFEWGHFGVVPLEPRTDEPNNGIFQWTDRRPSDVFADVRARPENPVLIINHPRSDGAQGYFSTAGYDPITQTAEHPDLWDDDIRVIEVFNSDSFDEALDVVTDWFSMLNAGKRVWAVGSSDSHRLLGSPVGYPRTCLRLGMDTPSELRQAGPNAVRDATRSGAFFVSGGIYIDATGRGDTRPGQTIDDAAATETIHVRVQAAPFVDVSALEVFVDGELVESLEIAESTNVVRFDEDIVVEPGSWVVFHAKGDGDLSPVHRGRSPFGVTMPIFFM